jgi:hypothetical protein
MVWVRGGTVTWPDPMDHDAQLHQSVEETECGDYGTLLPQLATEGGCPIVRLPRAHTGTPGVSARRRTLEIDSIYG